MGNLKIEYPAFDANDHSAGVEGDSQEWLRKNLYGSVYRT